MPDGSNAVEDRTFKLDFDTTSEYGRYVKSLWEAPWRARCPMPAPGKGRLADGLLLAFSEL